MTTEEADRLGVHYYINRNGIAICSDGGGCADPWYEPLSNVHGVCPDCGSPVDKDGDAVTGCHYSPCDCETCGHCGCDQSC